MKLYIFGAPENVTLANRFTFPLPKYNEDGLSEKLIKIIANIKEGTKNETAFRKLIWLSSWSLNGGWWVAKIWAPLLLLLAAHSSHEERTFWFNSLSSVVSSSWHLTVEESLVCRGLGWCGRSMRWCSTYWHQEAGFLTTLELLSSALQMYIIFVESIAPYHFNYFQCSWDCCGPKLRMSASLVAFEFWNALSDS